MWPEVYIHPSWIDCQANIQFEMSPRPLNCLIVIMIDYSWWLQHEKALLDSTGRTNQQTVQWEKSREPSVHLRKRKADLHSQKCFSEPLLNHRIFRDRWFKQLYMKLFERCGHFAHIWMKAHAVTLSWEVFMSEKQPGSCRGLVAARTRLHSSRFYTVMDWEASVWERRCLN